MIKTKLPIIGAVLTALLSTLCCLPAFLFIFFGVTSGVLTYFSTLEAIRVPLAILSIFLFIIAIYSSKQKLKCECDKLKRKKQYFKISMIFISLILLLTYPEILPYFME